MKPEVVIIRRADLMDNGFKKQEPSVEQADIAPAADQSLSAHHNNSIRSVKSFASRRSGVVVAPNSLTKEQFDILNLNGEPPL